MEETNICGITLSKDSIERIAVGFGGFFIAVICSVLFINSFLFPIVKFGDFEVHTSCGVNVSSISVTCADYWDANCVVSAEVTVPDDDGSGVTRDGRFPAREGSSRARAEEVADNLRTYSWTTCYYSEKNQEGYVVFEDPMPSTYGYVIFGAAGIIALAAAIFSAYCLIAGFCSVSRSTTFTVQKTGATEKSPSGSLLGQGTTTLLDNRTGTNSRNRFVAKVYGILSVQLLITFGIIAVTVIVEPVRTFAQSNWWLMLVGLGVSLLLLLPLFFFKNSHPFNLILLFLFTLGFAVEIAVVCSFYGVTIVFQAGVTTFVIFFALTLFCVQTKIDFSFLGAGLFCALCGMIAFSLLSWIFPVSGFTQVLYGYCGVVLFSLYILYDTTLLMEKYEESEHILASVNLYLDIMNIFLYLLYIFGHRK